MSYFKTVDGFTLHYLVDRAEHAQTKALLLHGYGEHTQRYDRFISELNHIRISVLRFDFRGHGHSAGLRGHIFNFQDYILDVK